MTDYEKYYEDEASKLSFAQMDYPEQEAIRESNLYHDLLLLEQDLADMRRCREMQCNEMLKTIDQMMQAELHRRIMGEKHG